MSQGSVCPVCHAQVQYGERFCGNCGTPLNWQAAQPPPPPPPPPYGTQAGGWQGGYQNQPPPQTGWQRQPYQNAPPAQTGWQQTSYRQQPPQWGQPNPYQQGQYGGYYGQPPQKKSSGLIIILVVLILIFFTVGGIGLATKGTFSFSSSSTDTSGQYVSVPQTTSPPVSGNSDNVSDEGEVSDDSSLPSLKTGLPEITAAQLIEEYNTSESYAGNTYGGKYYNVTGIVKGYSAATVPVWIALVGSSDDLLTVECRFLNTAASVIDGIAVGDSITIQGRISSYDLTEGAIVVSLSQIVP